MGGVEEGFGGEIFFFVELVCLFCGVMFGGVEGEGGGVVGGEDGGFEILFRLGVCFVFGGGCDYGGGVVFVVFDVLVGFVFGGGVI